MNLVLWSYQYMDGTSMAAPHVTGGIALYASTHPGKAAHEIRQALLQNAAATAALNGKTTTGARLNLAQVIAPSGGASATPAQFEAPAVINQQFRVRLKGAAGRCMRCRSPRI